MLKSLLTLAVVTMSLNAFAAGEKLLGTWQTPVVKSGGINFQATMSFTPDSVNLVNTCTKGAQSVSVSLTVRVQLEDNQFTVLQSDSKSESQGGLNCDVSAQAGTWPYSISADGKTLTQPGSPIKMTKIN